MGIQRRPSQEVGDKRDAPVVLRVRRARVPVLGHISTVTIVRTSSRAR